MSQAPQRSKTLKGKAGNAGPKKLAVLELKRATGIGIRMARLPVPWCHVREAILTCDDKVLRAADDVETILACVPTDEENRMLEVRIAFSKLAFSCLLAIMRILPSLTLCSAIPTRICL